MVYPVIKERSQHQRSRFSIILDIIGNGNSVFTVLKGECLFHGKFRSFGGKMYQSVISKGIKVFNAFAVSGTAIVSKIPFYGKIYFLGRTNQTLVDFGENDETFYRRVQAGNQIAVVFSCMGAGYRTAGIAADSVGQNPFLLYTHRHWGEGIFI